MRRASLIVVLIALVLTAAPSAVTTTSAAQLTARFKTATGQKLVLNRTASYAGHYRAYDLGVQSVATRARWGTFTVYLLTAADVDADMTRLLSDSRTGALGAPTAGGIYWEQGATLQGQVYWQAKRRYGQNVVVTWIGMSATKKTDASWKRLHTALTKATK
jgi:hypothetical protein